jgi:hypothetical protein
MMILFDSNNNYKNKFFKNIIDSKYKNTNNLYMYIYNNIKINVFNQSNKLISGKSLQNGHDLFEFFCSIHSLMQLM